MLRYAKFALAAAVVLSISVAGGPARAASINKITFQADGSVKKGDTVHVHVGFDFQDEALGGGLDLQFDTTHFKFSNFVFDPNFPDDPAFRLIPTPGQTDGPFVIALGNFINPLKGDKSLGTLDLIAQEDLHFASSGQTVLDAVDNVRPAGGFVSPAGDPLAVMYEPLNVVVPEPGTLLLLGSGLLGLAASRRQRS